MAAKFKAVNNRDRNFTSAKLTRRMEEIEASINRYLTDLDTADRQEPVITKARTARLQDKIAALKKQMQEMKEIEAQLNETPDKQISLTDPDARSMKTRGTGIVGYNVQTAVDAKHHLIVAHEVTNVGIGREHLSSVAKQARMAMDAGEITAIADRGYFKGEQILACHEAGITVIVPKTTTSGAKFDGRFDRADFIYDAQKNEYRCPAGDHLIWRYATIEDGLKVHRYWSSNCKGCAIEEKCTPSKQRRVTRWDREDVLESMQTRLDLAPDSMRIRRQTVEHPFGTIKLWMGSAHFLTTTLKNVSTARSGPAAADQQIGDSDRNRCEADLPGRDLVRSSGASALRFAA